MSDPIVLSRKKQIETAEQRPTPLVVHTPGIPPELHRMVRWVLWRYVRRDGRWTKQPLLLDGTPADITDPKHVSLYYHVHCACRRGLGDGVGYVFFADDPYCGIDLDDAFDGPFDQPNSPDPKLLPWAERIVRDLATYTERSPSNTGLKLFLKGKLPPGRRRFGSHVEMYDRDRFFCVTGWRWGDTPADVMERQDALAALHNRLTQQLETKVARGAVKGATSSPAPGANGGNRRFEALFAGDNLDYASASEADLALCGTLARWVGPDAERIDRFFRLSRRMRSKWDEKHGSLTYGELTVRKALENHTAEGERTLQVRRGSDVKPEQVGWLWQGWLPRGVLVVLDGDPGLGKSTLTLDLAARVTRGRPMPTGAHVVEPADVLLVAVEDSASHVMVPRLMAAGADLARVRLLEGVTLQRPGQPDVVREVQFPTDLDLVCKLCEECQPALLIIDPIFAVLGVDSDGKRICANDEQSLRQLTARFKDAAEKTGTTILLVRHLNKAQGGSAMDRGMGGKAFNGQSRAVLLAGADPDDPIHSRVLAMTKTNLGVHPVSLRYRLQSTPTPVGEYGKIEWLGECAWTANDLVKPPSSGERSQRPSPKADAAVEWLQQYLAAGPRPTTEVEAAAREAGHSGKSLRVARRALRVFSERIGGSRGSWVLSLPDAE